MKTQANIGFEGLKRIKTMQKLVNTQYDKGERNVEKMHKEALKQMGLEHRIK